MDFAHMWEFKPVVKVGAIWEFKENSKELWGLLKTRNAVPPGFCLGMTFSL